MDPSQQKGPPAMSNLPISPSPAKTPVRASRVDAITSAASERFAVGLAFGVSVAAAALWAVAVLIGSRVSVHLTPRPPPAMHPRLAALPPGPMLDHEGVSIGSEIFHETCVACHGASGMGIAGNGKNLVYSDFVANTDDAALAAFIKRGRDPGDPANTTGVGMPAKGGNPTLTDQDFIDVVTYLRALQDPRRVPAMPESTPAAEDSTTNAQN